MTEFTRKIMYGISPIHRTDPGSGESEWYYLDPRGASTFSDMKKIDVPTENSPNPYAKEIQNYLYENDEYNYKQLYGDTPPPSAQKQNNKNVQYMPTEQYVTTQKPQQLTSLDKSKILAENIGDGMQAGAVGFANGSTLGNFDEAMGALTAAFTSKPYSVGRDAVRQLQNDLQQRHPYIYGGAEFAGSMKIPMHFAKDTTFTNKAFNAFTDTLNASAGYAENMNDFYTNFVTNALANAMGLYVDKLPFMRGGSIAGRKFIKQGINYLADKTKNTFYNKSGEEDK